MSRKGERCEAWVVAYTPRFAAFSPTNHLRTPPRPVRLRRTAAACDFVGRVRSPEEEAYSWLTQSNPDRGLSLFRYPIGCPEATRTATT
jgi:hypothetical protein